MNIFQHWNWCFKLYITNFALRKHFGCFILILLRMLTILLNSIRTVLKFLTSTSFSKILLWASWSFDSSMILLFRLIVLLDSSSCSASMFTLLIWLSCSFVSRWITSLPSVPQWFLAVLLLMQDQRSLETRELVMIPLNVYMSNHLQIYILYV